MQGQFAGIDGVVHGEEWFGREKRLRYDAQGFEYALSCTLRHSIRVVRFSAKKRSTGASSSCAGKLESSSWDSQLSGTQYSFAAEVMPVILQQMAPTNSLRKFIMFAHMSKGLVFCTVLSGALVAGIEAGMKLQCLKHCFTTQLSSKIFGGCLQLEYGLKIQFFQRSRI